MTNSESDLEALKDQQREATERRAVRKKPRSTARQSAAARARTAAAKPTADGSANDAQAHEAEEAIQDLADQIETAVKKIGETASERPVLALLATFSIGVIVGHLFSRR
ncbi:MAG: hypothetical protein QNL62_07405 [Gammaproteobacteria bacterium]|nr:hypothetical protein [Gammaproteobacteria bacterium]